MSDNHQRSLSGKEPEHLKSFIRIFYDDKCGFCRRCICFVIKRRRRQFPLVFSPIHGQTFEFMRKNYRWKNLPNSLIFFNQSNHQLVVKGQAIIRIMRYLCFPWNLFSRLLDILPDGVLNYFYDKIAKNRNLIFKTSKSKCSIYKEEWRRYFEK